MYRRILLVVSAFTFCFFISIKTAQAQFQSLPTTDKKSVTGEKIKTTKDYRKAKSTKRYVENNNRKRKVKTEKKHVVGYSAGKFNAYLSSKTIRRKKLIAKKRRKLGSS